MTGATERPSRGLLAGADEVCGLGDVVAAGHLAVGDQEVGALAGPGDPGRRAGPATGEVGEAAFGAKLRGLRLRHGVEVELALGGEEHVLPGEGAEPPVVKVEVGKHQEALLAAFGQMFVLWVPGGHLMTRMGGSTELT